MDFIVNGKKELKALAAELIERAIPFSTESEALCILSTDDDREIADVVMDIMASWFPDKPHFRQFLEEKFNEQMLAQAAQEGE